MLAVRSNTMKMNLEKIMLIATRLVPPLATLVPLFLGLLFTSMAQAGPEEDIRGKLEQARPDFQIDSVKPSVATGIYEVQVTGGPVLYTTVDGDFFILGDLFSVGINGIVNLAEQQRDMERRDLLATVKKEDMIIFPAEGETRASISVFTDVDCFYCQKLHQEVPALNAAGVEVRYLAYPRAGLGSESYRKIATAWCSDDPQEAITQLKNRETLADNVCPDNPVADQFMLGQKAGVRGTPAMVLEDGKMLPGYMSAQDLTARMGIN
jgi:thiol:disulfide interchange protein DsbC